MNMKLQEIRKYKGFTQEKAAKIANIPLRTYKRIEADERYEGTLKYQSIYNVIYNSKNVAKSNAKNTNKKVTIIGAGYVGLASGILLSKKYKVEFVDKDENVCKNIESKYGFSCYSSIKQIDNFEIVLLCLPTNLNEKTQKFDTENIYECVKNIISTSPNPLIVLRSTVSIGFTRDLGAKFNLKILFMPEFLREASFLYDINNPTRVIAGIDDSSQRINNFIKGYMSCIDNAAPLIKMSTSEAEATKLFSNAYLATRLAFYNEVDSFSKETNLDSSKIIEGMGLDPRIGDYYNEPSCGYSGYCLPKDTKVLNGQIKSDLLKGVISSNEKRKDNVTAYIANEALKITSNPVIGFYGYNLVKTNGVLRSSAILEIIEKLKKYPVKVVVFDTNYPNGETNLDSFIKKCTLIVYKNYDSSLDKAKHLINIKR